MGEITIKAKIPRELEGYEREIEDILRKKVAETIKKLEIRKKSQGIIKTEKSWQELQEELYEDIYK
jgi:hypothetical protein